MKNTLRYATLLAFGTAVISGTNVFLTKIVSAGVGDPVVFTTLKNAIVAMLMIGIVLMFKKWPEIRKLTKSQALKLVAIGVVGGSIPFVLFFSGLAHTSAINAAMIHKTLFIWVLIIALPILKERIASWQWLGIAAIFAANLFIGGFQGFQFGIGELMILGATILWAVENIIAKVALKDLSSLTVASARMVIGSIILIGIVTWQGNIGLLSGLGTAQWGWILLASVLLLGYVLSWYTALKYAPATYVATLIVPATLITNVLSAVFITKVFTSHQFASSILYIAGIMMMVHFAKQTTDRIAIGDRGQKGVAHL
ncbi:MAG: DMT family transporter [bacterium]